ncbi:hypothetical protein ALC62_09135, partial [Cyphomyrmex costatus]
SSFYRSGVLSTEDEVATGMSVYIHERSIVLFASLQRINAYYICMCHSVSVCVYMWHVNICDTWSKRAFSAIFGRITRCKEEARVKHFVDFTASNDKIQRLLSSRVLSVTPLNGMLTRVIGYPVLIARQEYRHETWLSAVCETSIAARSRLRVAGSGGTARRGGNFLSVQVATRAPISFLSRRYRSLIARAMDGEPLLAANAPWRKPVPSRTDRFDPSTRSMHKHPFFRHSFLPLSAIVPFYRTSDDSRTPRAGSLTKNGSKKVAVDSELCSKRLLANRKSDGLDC